MKLNEFIEKVKKQSERFGFCFESQPRKAKNAVWRKNIHPEKVLSVKFWSPPTAHYFIRSR